MKKTLALTPLSLIAFLAMPAALSAATTLVTDGSNWSTDSTGASGLNTTTPSFPNADGKYFYTTFNDVTLGVADTITYQTTMSFSASSGFTTNGLRIGLFNNEGDTDPTDGGWTGFWLYGSGNISQGTDSTNHAWTATGATQLTGWSRTDTGSFDVTGGTFSISMGLTRETTDTYSIAYTIQGVNGGNTYDVVSSWSGSPSYTLTGNQINTFGILATGLANVNSATVIPEPSTYAALLGVVALLATLSRRRYMPRASK